MKSKRKEVNKFKNKHQLKDQEQHNEQYIKRATGVKPFHLSKIRTQKKFSEEFLHKKQTLNLIVDRLIKQNQNSQKGNVYLDLIVKKKLLIDVRKNVKLQSQRKSLLYLDIDRNDEPEGNQFLFDKVDTDEKELKNVKSQNLQAFKSQDFTNKVQKNKKNVTKCDCYHQMEGFTTQAVVCKANYLKDKIQPFSQRSNSQQSQNVIDSKAELRNIIQKASKSPFSFTNIKWRSKSELMTVVDKWKQKYQNQNDSTNHGLIKHKSVPKIMGNYPQTKKQFTAKKRVFLQKKIKQKKKVTLPSINNQDQKQICQKPQQKIEFIITVQKPKQEKKGQGQRKQKQKRKQLEPQLRFKQNIQNDFLIESQNSIVIKEMFTKHQIQNQIQVRQIKNVSNNQQQERQKQDTLLAMTKYQRQRNKKIKSLRSKFPQIKVSTFYSTKQNYEQKKMKLNNLQKMITQSKIKWTKKFQFQKSLQQIPERWEYGQSHQYSREEVEHYLSIKKQEEIRQIAASYQQKKRQSKMQQQVNVEQTQQRKQSIQAIQQSLINRVV